MIKQNGQAPGGPQDCAPAYFTSITVENFRCFAEAQTLNLARPDGAPASWTVIVGENGAGKTTLLQCLAGMLPEYVSTSQAIFQSPPSGESKINYIFVPKICTASWLNYLKAGSRGSGVKLRVRSTIVLGNKLISSPVLHPEKETCEEWGGDFTLDPENPNKFEISSLQDLRVRLGGLTCYGYGAGSRLAKKTHGDEVTHDTIATLFNLEAALPNAEEWLLTLDHVSKTESPTQDKIKGRLGSVHNWLEGF